MKSKRKFDYFLLKGMYVVEIYMRKGRNVRRCLKNFIINKLFALDFVLYYLFNYAQVFKRLLL